MSQTASQPTVSPQEKKQNPALLRRVFEWLFSSQHFHLKLLGATSVGLLVIIFLAVTCFVVTSRNQRQAQLQAHMIEVMRLTSVLENDIAALENAHRGYLLTHDAADRETFSRLEGDFQRHSEQIRTVLASNSQQRKRIVKMRENILNWLTQKSLLMRKESTWQASRLTNLKELLSAPQLDEAREILHSIQREEQIVLGQHAREQEWALQSTQVLDFIPRLERAVYEMQKEKRGYVLTGDPSFIESYRRAVANFYTCQGHLSVLVANSPAETAQLERIRAALERWITQCAVPEIEAKRAGREFSASAGTRIGERLMLDVRSLTEQFEKEQTELYQTRRTAAAHEQVLNTWELDLGCALVSGLMILSSCYSFAISRRQLRKLGSAETRIRTLIDNILDGMITVNAHGAIHSMNPAAKRMFGAKDDFLGEPFTRLVPKYFASEADNVATPCDWERLASRTGGTLRALAQSCDGLTFPVEISLSEMVVEKEKFHIAMIRDVTQRRHSEEELAAERNSLAVTLGSIGDGVITTDLHGRIVIFNPACASMTGWNASDAVGQTLKTVFNITADGPTQYRGGNNGYRSEAQAILLTTPERARLTARDGTERIIEQKASPIRDAKNDLCGVVLVFRDITQRQRDEVERRKADTLEQLGVLAGGIAHDFNNLLTAIIGNISLATLLLPPNDKLIERLDDAKNASLRARDLAQQLLTFARGGAPIKKSGSIGKLIEDTVGFSLRGSHNRSDLQIEPNLWLSEFDAGQISQVIANLAVNADQAMPNGGTLHITCDNFTYGYNVHPVVPDLPHGDYIRIMVRDEGCGIPEKYLKQIFDPYFTTKPKGNGLGLATAYSVIKNHSGFITVDSELHVGSTFTIYLPAARQEALVEPAVDSTPLLAGSGRVLIVDDEETIRDLVDFTLTGLGYEVVGAENALSGVELYRNALQRGERFDLVILDLTLPGGMGGKEALKRLIEIDPTVNAIVSSGYAMDATMSRYQDFGFRGMIAKPYEAGELARTVYEAIQSSRVNYSANFELQQAV